jgi:hypothetical protein
MMTCWKGKIGLMKPRGNGDAPTRSGTELKEPAERLPWRTDCVIRPLAVVNAKERSMKKKLRI